jgi:hypothetical protein
MRLYHGSVVAVATPDAAHSHRKLDFGPGFYLTSFEQQAKRWALRKALRVAGQGQGVVSSYEFQVEFADYSMSD